MRTITFYSYKGGSGRSLTVANAALYLQRLDFRVVVVDFDLEAPGMHYKFAFNPETGRLPVTQGLVDYIYQFVTDGSVPKRVSDFAIPLNSSNSEPELALIPAGDAPEPAYWQKLSRINWHELFFSETSHGVELFLDFKNKIEKELRPDFLLIDSRTGITETGGIATSLLADRIICLVSPSRENLEGARSVLQSVSRTRREYKLAPAEITIALSRLPEMEQAGSESEVITGVLKTLNQESESLEDTLAIKADNAIILHSEKAIEIREALRVGSGMNPEDSILLRDYLRLFAGIVPQDLVSSKLQTMMAKAREKIWDNPDEAVKEVEELAESFGHPDTYRELLRFYDVRNVKGIPVLRRAQRLWEITRDSRDPILWGALSANFPLEPRSPRRRDSEPSFQPRTDFVEAVWREAGNRNIEFGKKLAESYQQKDPLAGIAILQEIIDSGNARADVVSQCLAELSRVGRAQEARQLIERFQESFGTDPEFALQWGQYALASKDLEYIKVLTNTPYLEMFQRNTASLIPLRLLVAGERKAEAVALAERTLFQGRRDPDFLFRTRTRENIQEAAEAFAALDLGSEFLELLDRFVPDDEIERLRRRLKITKPQGKD